MESYTCIWYLVDMCPWRLDLDRAHLQGWEIKFYCYFFTGIHDTCKKQEGSKYKQAVLMCNPE